MESYAFDSTDKRSVNTLIGRVYGYMFIGILLTAVIAFAVGMLFNYWMFGTINTANIDYDAETKFNSQAAMVLIGTLIVSSIALIVISFVVHIVFARGKHSVLVPSLLYCSMMGLMLSSLVIFIPWEILGITFLITALMFGIMFIISWLTKGSMHFLGVLGIGMFMGAGILALIGFILALTGALGAYMQIYWIVSLLTFAAMMFITMWDMWRIKQIAQGGEMNDNLALYCAFILYVDFVYLFLRVLRFVVYLMGRKN